MDKIKIGIQAALGIITGIFKLFTSILKGDWSGAWEALKSIASNMITGIKNSISIVLEAIKAVFGDKFNAAKDKVFGIIDGIKSGISTKINNIKVSVKPTQIS